MRPFTLGAGELLLDEPTEADVDAIAGYCQDPVFERFLTLPWPYARKDAEFFVNEYVPHGWESGTEVMAICLSRHPPPRRLTPELVAGGAPRGGRSHPETRLARPLTPPAPPSRAIA